MDVNITINVNAGEDKPEVAVEQVDAPDALAGGILRFPEMDGRARRAPGVTGNPILDMIGV